METLGGRAVSYERGTPVSEGTPLISLRVAFRRVVGLVACGLSENPSNSAVWYVVVLVWLE